MSDKRHDPQVVKARDAARWKRHVERIVKINESHDHMDAALDLYEACKKARDSRRWELYEQHHPYHSAEQCAAITDNDEVLNALNAAIAKYEGKP